MIKTVDGRVLLWDLETGEQREFWPIDAGPLLALGTHTSEPPEGTVVALPPAPPEMVGAPVRAQAKTPVASAGYRVEQSSPQWWKLYGPDGEQVGNAQRSEAEARALIPADNEEAPKAEAGEGG